MVNKLLRAEIERAEPVAEQPPIRVYNASGIRQGHGCVEMKPGEWTPVPHDLAMRLVGDPNYRVEGFWVPPASEGRGVMLSPWVEMQAKRREGKTGYPSVAVVIPVYNCPDLLRKCSATLATTRYPGELRFIWVDNGSTDVETQCILHEVSDGKQLSINNPHGFAYAVNTALKSATEDYFCLFNQDCEVTDGDWLTKLIDWMESHPACGICGPKLVYPNGTIQHAGIQILAGGNTAHEYRFRQSDAPEVCTARQVSAVTGAVFVANASLWKRLKGFDEGYPFGHEDVDFCLRAIYTTGAETWYVPGSRITHLDNGVRKSSPETQERAQKWSTESERLFVSRWSRAIDRCRSGEAAILLPAHVDTERCRTVWSIADHLVRCGLKTTIYTWEGLTPQGMDAPPSFGSGRITERKPTDTVIATGWETMRLARNAERRFLLDFGDTTNKHRAVGISPDEFITIPAIGRDRAILLAECATKILGVSI